MTVFCVVWYALAAAVFAALMMCRHNENAAGQLQKLFRAAVICFVAVAFINVFMPDLFSKRGLAGNNTPTDEFFTYRDPAFALLRWANAVAVVVLPFAVFYKKKQLSRITSFLILPVALLSAAFFNTYMEYYTNPAAPSVFGESSRVLLQSFTFRAVLFGLLLMLEFACAAYVTIRDRKQLPFRGAKDLGLFFAVLPACILTNIPIYVPQHLLGTYSEIILTIGQSGHFLFIAAVILEGIALHFILRKQSNENKYIALFIMVLSLLFQYNTFFRTDGIINASRWPFQLCNISGAFLLICMLSKSEKMYHFTVVINTVGAVIAIAMCDSTKNTGIFYCMNIHYMAEHTNVLLVPLLMGTLHLFKPLKKNDIKDVFAGFTVYFLLVLAVGTVLVSLGNKTGDSFYSGVNFLFMFNRDASAGMLPFTGALFDMKWNITPYVSFSIVQLAVYAAFLLLCTGFFFLLYIFFREKNTAPRQITGKADK